MKRQTPPPKNDRERAIWRAAHAKGWDDAFRAKMLQPKGGTQFLDSLSLKGNGIDIYGDGYDQDLLVSYAKVHGEEAIRILILHKGHDAEYWLTMKEAKQFAQWLTKRTTPSKPKTQAKPKGPSNG